jgi:hypothetical protein
MTGLSGTHQDGVGSFPTSVAGGPSVRDPSRIKKLG